MDEPQKRPYRKIAVIAICAAIVTPIVISYLIDRYQDQRIETKQSTGREGIQQNNAQTSQQQQEKLQEEIVARRSADTNGATLQQKCSEWTTTYVQLNSDFALQEREKYCGQLERYMKTGALSP